MRIVIQKADLDTCLAGAVMEASRSDKVVWRNEGATAEELADARVVTLEAGGSGDVARNNFDHHNTKLALPPASAQAFAARGRPSAYRLLTDFTELVDQHQSFRLPPFPNVSHLISGVRLVHRGDQVAQFVCGVEALRRTATLQVDPFAVLPCLPEWQNYLRVFEQSRIENGGSPIEMVDVQGFRIGFTESASPAVRGQLYRLGANVAVVHAPPRLSISGDNFRVDGLLPVLNSLDPGWGGPSHGTIIGSPRAGSTLSFDAVRDIVTKNACLLKRLWSFKTNSTSCIAALNGQRRNDVVDHVQRIWNRVQWNEREAAEELTNLIMTSAAVAKTHRGALRRAGFSPDKLDEWLDRVATVLIKHRHRREPNVRAVVGYVRSPEVARSLPDVLFGEDHPEKRLEGKTLLIEDLVAGGLTLSRENFKPGATEELKNRVDREFAHFMRAEVRKKNGERFRTLMLEVILRPWPPEEADCIWPFWRFYRWINERRNTGPETEHRIGNSRVLTTHLSEVLNVTENNLYQIKSRLREVWEAWRGSNVNHDRLAEAAEDVRRGVLPAGLELIKDALQIRTDWEDYLLQTVNAAPATSLFVAVFPPLHTDEALACAIGLRNRSESPVHIAFDEVDYLKPTIERMLQEAEGGLIVVPMVRAFFDQEEALSLALSQPGFCVLMLAPSLDPLEQILEARKDARVIALDPMYSREEIEDRDRASFEAAVRRSEHGAIIETICLFTAWHRRPPVSVIAELCKTELDIVIQAVERSNGFLKLDRSRPDEVKVSWDEEGRAARHIVRKYADAELGARYRKMMELSALKPANRHALANLFWYWRIHSPQNRRLARLALGLPGPVDDALRHVEEETDAEERLRWAEVFESVGQFSTAHDILLKTTVPAGLRHQHRMLTAQILTEQCVVAGFSTARDIADALYGECDSCPEALRPAVYEAWATCRLKTGNPSGAENVIRKISPVRGRAASILAHALAAQNRWTEARGYSGANPREFDLERQSTETYEDYQRRWSSHVHKLLSESTVITAIHQAAQHALDRGHFATAKLLLDRGFAQDPDNLYLNLTSAKLLHEQGGYAKAIKHYEAILNQIAGRENTLVKYACLDTEIEGCRRGIRKSIEQPVPRPLSRRNEEPIFLTRPFECRALGLQAKYVWHGPKEMSHRLEWSGHSSLADLVSAILQTDPDPPLQSQMARMLASPEVNDAQQARRVAKAAVKAADDNQALLSRIICRNTLARILPSSEAEAVLKESLDLDPANTYTLFLMSEVLDWTGRAEQAEEYSSRANRFRDQPLVRQQAESN